MHENKQTSNTDEQVKAATLQKKQSQQHSKNKQFQSPYKTREGKLGPIQSKQGIKPPIQAKQRPVNKSKIDSFKVKSEAYHQNIEENYGPVMSKKDATSESVQRQAHKSTKRAPQGSTKFQEIATAMGEQHGVDTTSLKAAHNSSFPATVNAEATIQGNKIDFAPSKDTEHNMKHEVGHFIDNAKNGTPKGNTTIHGYSIDTTREKIVDSIMNTPLQKKTEKNSLKQMSVKTSHIPEGAEKENIYLTRLGFVQIKK